MKASLHREAGGPEPTMACHRSGSASGTKAKCGIRSRCGRDHSKALWNPEAPYLPEFVSDLPLLPKLPFYPGLLIVDWPTPLIVPPAPPPQAAFTG